VTDIGFVVFGDVVRSRVDAPAATAWLRELIDELEVAYPAAARLAPFAFTQGDELQGLLRIGADPFEAVLRGTLGTHALPMRWVVVAGGIDPGRGPATERTGSAFLAARELLEEAATRRDGLLVRVGDQRADDLLDGLAPLLADLLADLTDRQRALARLMLVEHLRQSEVAERLGVSRATISVMAERARIRRIDGLLAALRRIVADAIGLESGAMPT
jgi:DNA-binding CsgD family transcriptional regulator